MGTIALFPGSFKPYHAGHDSMVRLAAGEADEVHLFVSTSDRKRRGELPIRGEDMHRIWLEYIEPTLPDNVVVTYGGVPIQNLYRELEEAEASGSEDTYVIYSDEEDILKYTPSTLGKSAPTLFENGQIELRGVSRSETVPVSGTAMRVALAAGNTREFSEFLPPKMRRHSRQIIDILTSGSMGETLLRRYTRQFLRRESLSLSRL